MKAPGIIWIMLSLLMVGRLDLIAGDIKAIPHWRHPSALIWANDRLLTANEKSGSVSVIDPIRAETIHESKIGERLVDLLELAETGIFATLDSGAHQIILFTLHSDRIQTIQRIDVPTDPISMVVSPSGKRLTIASRWAARLSFLNIPNQSSFPQGFGIEDSFDLPFAPRLMAYLKSENYFAVADNFGGKLAVIDLHKRTIESIYDFPANNIRGLFVDASGRPSLWMTSESLNSLAMTFRPEVLWGVMMGNHLRKISLEDLSLWGSDGLHLGEVISLGDETGPGGDPGAVLMSRQGNALIVLSGVDRLAVQLDLRTFLRVKVGDRPIDLVLHPDKNLVYVANQFSDSISVVDLEAFEVKNEISLGPRIELTSVDRGERLFHDASLSPRGWFSCHSCHTDGHTNEMLNDNLGDNDFGAPKRVLSLLGVSGTEPLSWLGKVESLEDQIQKSMEKTMIHTSTTDEMISDLAAYLRTLKTPPSIFSARNDSETPHDLIQQGSEIFHSLKCNRCHSPPKYTSPKIFDVGLEDVHGNHKFNPPSLRGVSQRKHFFHDNRAQSLEAVFTEFQHPNHEAIPPSQLKALLSFLNSL